jgi:hypothetical protein
MAMLRQGLIHHWTCYGSGRGLDSSLAIEPIVVKVKLNPEKKMSDRDNTGPIVVHITNQCTRIAMLRFLEAGYACGVTLTLKVASLARNRVISSGVIRLLENRTEGYVRKSGGGSLNP